MKIKNKQNKNESGKVLRIVLTSQKIRALEQMCRKIITISLKKKLKIKGPVSIPTKCFSITTRKSPCGEGTNTWDHFEMKIHKRIIDIFGDNNLYSGITGDSHVEMEAIFLN